MTGSPHEYVKLTRPVSGVGSYSSLWLARDHLLQVTSTGYTESYRRFYFHDIKAIGLMRSDRRLYWGLFWGGLGFLVLIAVGVAAGYGVALAWVGGSFGVPLLWNFLLGPSCASVIMTGVQTERIPSLARRRKALKVLARIRPLIEEAQAALAPPGPPPPG